MSGDIRIMNAPELEQLTGIKVKPVESKEREKAYCIECLNQSFYKDLRDTMLAQIVACERLLIETNNKHERNVIEKETLILKLILDLLEY
jgi:hypothetical protein